MSLQRCDDLRHDISLLKHKSFIVIMSQNSAGFLSYFIYATKPALLKKKTLNYITGIKNSSFGPGAYAGPRAKAHHPLTIIITPHSDLYIMMLTYILFPSIGLANSPKNASLTFSVLACFASSIVSYIPKLIETPSIITRA